MSMTLDRAPAPRAGADYSLAVLGGGFALIAASVVLDRGPALVAVAVAVGFALFAMRRALGWPTIAMLLLAVVLFIPIGRYSIPVKLPFDLEPYRVFVGAILVCWVAALLADPRIRLRRTPFDRAIGIIVLAVLGSVAANPGRVAPLQAEVLKALTFFASFVLVYYFLVSISRTKARVEAITKVLVAGTAVVALAAIIEERIQYNVFDHIGGVIPLLQFNGAIEISRYGLHRAVGSSSHPIELGVLLAMALPLGLALTFSVGRRWAIPTGVLAVGVMASVSRTPIVVLVAAGLVLLWLQPTDLKKLAPLIVPGIVVVQLALPGSLATVKNLFFPQGGLVAEGQQLSPEADPMLAGGRIRQIRPSLEEASGKPLLGQGFGTRQTGFFNPLRNAPILDNEWLTMLLEAGALAVVGWAMLFVSAARRLGRASRRRAGPDSWLAAGFAASIVGFAVGMFTFDALEFSQVTFMIWIVAALSASLLLADAEADS
jgi:hypothetical protein